MTMVYKMYLKNLQKICISYAMKTKLKFSKDDFVIEAFLVHKKKMRVL